MAFKIRETKEDQTHRHDKRTLFRHQRGKCGGCGFAFEFRKLQMDQIVPLTNGGTDRLEKLQILCAHCNHAKGEVTVQDSGGCHCERSVAIPLAPKSPSGRTMLIRCRDCHGASASQ